MIILAVVDIDFRVPDLNLACKERCEINQVECILNCPNDDIACISECVRDNTLCLSGK